MILNDVFCEYLELSTALRYAYRFYGTQHPLSSQIFDTASRWRDRASKTASDMAVPAWVQVSMFIDIYLFSFLEFHKFRQIRSFISGSIIVATSPAS